MSQKPSSARGHARYRKTSTRDPRNRKPPPTSADADDLSVYDEVASHVDAFPLGEAPLDLEVIKIARHGKLGIIELALLDVRRRVLGAWWSARFVVSEQREMARNQFAVPSRAYRQRLRRVRAALAEFRCEDRRSSGSPLDMLAALGDSAAAELTNDLWTNVRATQRAARRASKRLAAIEREYEARGRPGAPTFVFAKKLARLWHELSGTLPSVTHSSLDDRWTGLFVAFVAAAAETLNTDELGGNLPVAADKAARQYRREFHRHLQRALPLK
jgi:hypothetical protein